MLSSHNFKSSTHTTRNRMEENMEAKVVKIVIRKLPTSKCDISNFVIRKL